MVSTLGAASFARANRSSGTTFAAPRRPLARSGAVAAALSPLLTISRPSTKGSPVGTVPFTSPAAIRWAVKLTNLLPESRALASVPPTVPA